ncbi:hypothetical protein Sar04_32950 [Salinispora arenicola]|uniref:Uncharacterized protein n=1 Tax=Salinispora arenicola TaxID=168697 RepID=A0A542XUI6_SALAC|nr:hypothetical protein FB564_4769 [Salinispora arenicola]GIM86559.1 hypothetical protein Sar04_32950 [Salinispora arenicola]
METLLYISAVIAAVGAAEVLRRASRGALVAGRKVSRLVDDMLGEPTRPGLPDGHHGIMTRVLSSVISLVPEFSFGEGVDDGLPVRIDLGWERLRGVVDREGRGT